MVLLVDLVIADRAVDRQAFQRLQNRFDVRTAGLLDGLGPQLDVNVGVHHRVIGHALLFGDAALFTPRLVRLHPLEVLRGLQRHVVVPRSQVAGQGLDVQGLQFHLGKAERNDRAGVGGDALVGQFLEEGHVAVAVDGVDHGAIAAGAEAFDLADDGLVVLVVERRVLLGDAVFRYALGLGEIEPQNLVRGTRVDVVRTDQVEALLAAAFRAHQVIHRRGRLLVDRRAGVDDVLRTLFAFVLDGVEEEAVVLLEHRQHGLAAYRGPAAENRRHLILGQELLGLFGEEVPVGGGIFDDRLDRAPQHAAILVDFVNGHEDDFLEGSLTDGHGAA